jgi:hypothetical protein
MGIVRVLRQDAVDTLFDLEGAEFAVWRIVDTGFLQP